MTSQVLAENPDLILKDGTLVTINETYGVIWFHPDGHLTQNSYRLNLNLKTIDVNVADNQTNGE